MAHLNYKDAVMIEAELKKMFVRTGHKPADRMCLECNKIFQSKGYWNRRCDDCHISEDIRYMKHGEEINRAYKYHGPCVTVRLPPSPK